MNNDFRVKIPNEFFKVDSMPNDPPYSTAYMKKTEMSNFFAMIYPIYNNYAMPYDDEKMVIDQIHNTLDNEQGLIEVKSGYTCTRKRYIYSIVKTKLNPTGMQYVLTMDIEMQDYAMHIQCFGDEVGETGLRDNVILNKLVNDGSIILPDIEGWFKDPYNPNFKKGILMNASEKVEYDRMFPLHPLSEIRDLIKYVIENN